MAVAPRLEDRPALPYLALRDKLHRDHLGTVIPTVLADVSTAMQRLNVTPSGPPLARYLAVDYHTGEVEVHVGFTVAIATAPAHLDHLRFGELPAGRYAVVTHHGPYRTLTETTSALLRWVPERGLSWQMRNEHDVTHWTGRVERYLVRPPGEPVPANWRTEIAILLKA